MDSAGFPFEIRGRVSVAAAALFADVEHHMPDISVADHVKNLNATNRTHPGGVGLVLSEIGLIAGSTCPNYKAVSNAFATLATLTSKQDPKNSCILLQMAHLCLPRNLKDKVEPEEAQCFQQALNKVQSNHPQDQAIESVTKMLAFLVAEQISAPDAQANKPRTKRERIEQQERQEHLIKIVPTYQRLATNAEALLGRASAYI